MNARFGVSCAVRRLALRCGLGLGLTAFGAGAQPAPTHAPGGAPPAPTSAPGGGPPPTTEPPPALAPSPLLDNQAQPVPSAQPTEPPPPPPTYENTQPEPSEPAPPPPPDEAPKKRSAGPFSRGSIRLSLLIGTGWTATDEYLILGAGAGYYLLDGLEAGLDYEAWLFGSPVMHRLSPGVKYVFHMVPVLKPYVGAFYRHTFVNDFQDFNYVGGRAGVFLMPKPSGSYFGAGAVYEHLLNCPADSWIDCDNVYPEVFIGISI